MDPQDATDGLIPIGRFSRLSGLSIGALRHYDELDLLRPADVDRFTGYRRYRPAQLDVARVYSTLGRGEPALWHARRCLQVAEGAVEAGVADDWDVPAALEGLARAQAVAGDRAAAEATRARARETVQAIADPEDRQLIEQDLETTPI